MEYKGIGSGIANLFIIYLMEREMASVDNPSDIFMKVDVHKGRIPINTAAVIPDNGEIHQSDISKGLELAYRKTIQKLGEDTIMADSSLWIIGSEICYLQDYSRCKAGCPLVDKYCITNVGLDKESGRYLIVKDGKRVETRRNLDQMHFDF